MTFETGHADSINARFIEAGDFLPILYLSPPPASPLAAAFTAVARREGALPIDARWNGTAVQWKARRLPAGWRISVGSGRRVTVCSPSLGEDQPIAEDIGSEATPNWMWQALVRGEAMLLIGPYLDGIADAGKLTDLIGDMKNAGAVGGVAAVTGRPEEIPGL